MGNRFLAGVLPLLTGLLLAGIAAGQRERIGHCNLFPVPSNGKFGYMDGSGRLVIRPQYDEAGCFRDGRARTVLNGRVGYIDLNGRAIGWLPQIEDSWLFVDGLSPFRETLRIGGESRNAIGYKDRTGKIVIPAQYASGKRFSEGVAAVKTNRGEEWSRDWGYVDATGRLVIPFQFPAARSFHEGLAAVTVREKGVHGLFKQGVIDRSGRMVIAPQAWFIEGDFSEGLVAVEAAEDWPRHTRFGYVDRTGKWVIPPRFAGAAGFSEGLAAVDFDPPPSGAASGPLGYIGKLGQTLIPPAFTSACPFQNGLAMVQIGRKVGFINRQGKFVWGPKEEPVYREGPEGDVSWPCPGEAYLPEP